LSVFAEHETTDNGNIKTHNNRIGVSKNLWQGAKARSTYTQERTDQGQRNYATLGLSQNIKINDKIRADFSIDQAKTIGGSQKRFNENEPTRQGSITDDYTAFSVGLGSNDKDWSWTSRAEYRNGELQDKFSLLGSIIRHYDNGKNISGKFSYYETDDENGDFTKQAKLSFGSAWHPKERDTVFFSRLDLVSEESSNTTADSVNAFANSNDNNTRKVIHNMHYNRKINPKTQIGIHHGINVSVGVNPKRNIWLELGYNIEGFSDDDFDNSNHTSEGVYVDFRYKFNQDTLKGDMPVRRKQEVKEVTKAKIIKKNNNKKTITNKNKKETPVIKKQSPKLETIDQLFEKELTKNTGSNFADLAYEK